MMSAAGLIDLHSHLLPGIDDGCRTLAESRACVRTLMKCGFVGTVCTPHMAIDAFPNITPAMVARWVAALQEQLQLEGLEYQLWPGGELRIDEHTVDWLEQHGVPTLGPSRNVLIDFWGDEWPAYAEGVVEYLFRQRYQPILAHPERMDLPDAEWDALLDRMQQRGVWLQGNLKCIAWREGLRTGERSHQLLREDRYRLLATDMHGTPDLPDRLAGLAVAEEQVGGQKLRELLAEGPRQVVACAE